MDFETCDIHLQPSYFDGVRGGILSEEMGFGYVNIKCLISANLHY